MATSTRTIRAADAIWAMLDARADKEGKSANALAAEILGESLIGDDAPPAPKQPKASKRAPPKPAAIVPASQLRERDLSPRLKAAPSGQPGRSSGIVSGLDIPLGNTRAPMQKGAGKAKAR